MKGMILDVYPEGSPTFKGCVLEVIGGDFELARIVNLDNGEVGTYSARECDTENPIIPNVFDFNQDE